MTSGSGPAQAPPVTNKTIYSKQSTSSCTTSPSAVSHVPHPNLLPSFSEAQDPRTTTKPDPTISIDGRPIPTVKTLCIRGVHYYHDGSGAAYLLRLQTTVSQLTHLIRRICCRRLVLTEAYTCRILQAMLTSRITYGVP